MKIRTEKFKADISNLVFAAIPLFLLTGHIVEYLIAFVSIALHELGHAVVANAGRCRVERLTITPFGLSISINGESLSNTGSLLVFSAGPAVNLLIAEVSVLLGRMSVIPADLSDIARITNICLAVFNLIPAIPLDGGRIMYKLLAGRIGLIAAGKILRTAAFILAGILFITGFCGIAGNGIDFCLSLTGLYIAVLLRKGGMEGALMNIKDIIYRKSRLVKKGIYPVRDLVAIRSTPVAEALKNLDFDRFHFIYVLDEDLKLLGMLNENEIVEGMVENNTGITFGELLEICREKQDY